MDGPAGPAGDDVAEFDGVKVVTRRVAGLEKPVLRALADSMRDRLGSGVVVLASAGEGKVALLVSVTKDLTNRVHAGKLAKAIAPIVGGRGAVELILQRPVGESPTRSTSSSPKAESSWVGCSREHLPNPARLVGPGVASAPTPSARRHTDETDHALLRTAPARRLARRRLRVQDTLGSATRMSGWQDHGQRRAWQTQPRDPGG